MESVPILVGFEDYMEVIRRFLQSSNNCRYCWKYWVVILKTNQIAIHVIIFLLRVVILPASLLPARLKPNPWADRISPSIFGLCLGIWVCFDLWVEACPDRYTT